MYEDHLGLEWKRNNTIHQRAAFTTALDRHRMVSIQIDYNLNMGISTLSSLLGASRVIQKNACNAFIMVVKSNRILQFHDEKNLHLPSSSEVVLPILLRLCSFVLSIIVSLICRSGFNIR